MAPALMRAVLISVAVGVVVQAAALVIARRMGRDRVMAGWGMGSLLRMVTLVLYGWLVVPALGLPLAPALLSLVIFFFVTMLIEPLLLSR